jgi:hypothetical protein
MSRSTKLNFFLAALSAGAALFMAGCAADKENVLAVTGTVIGVQIHQKDTDKTPELKVGYARTEFAYVPTDKRSDTNASSGSAAKSANVLMEINANGNVGLGTAYQGGIYQRLAVGEIAVSQPGAAVMMAKNQDGQIDPSAAVAVANATKNINNIPTQSTVITDRKMKILGAYNSASPEDKKKFENAAKAAGYDNFSDFCTKIETTDERLKKVEDSLKSNGINF